MGRIRLESFVCPVLSFPFQSYLFRAVTTVFSCSFCFWLGLLGSSVIGQMMVLLRLVVSPYVLLLKSPHKFGPRHQMLQVHQLTCSVVNVVVIIGLEILLE